MKVARRISEIVKGEVNSEHNTLANDVKASMDSVQDVLHNYEISTGAIRFGIRHALDMAEFAWAQGNYGIGACLIGYKEGSESYYPIAGGVNRVKSGKPYMHAEIDCLKESWKCLRKTKDQYKMVSSLHVEKPDEVKYVLFSTLEPCPMCISAILLSNRPIHRVIYLSKDRWAGGCNHMRSFPPLFQEIWRNNGTEFRYLRDYLNTTIPYSVRRRGDDFTKDGILKPTFNSKENKKLNKYRKRYSEACDAVSSKAYTLFMKTKDILDRDLGVKKNLSYEEEGEY